MANRRIEVDIVANDQASSVFRKVGDASTSMAHTLMKGLNSTANAVNDFDNTLRNYNSSMWRFNNVVSNAVRNAGDSVYNFTKDAIVNFSELEKQHAKTMGAMATEYGKTAEAQAKFLSDSEKLKKQAIEIGTYGVNGRGSLNSIVDVSYAQTALVKAGMSSDDLLNTDAVGAIMKFAGGNDLDIDTATTFAVNLATVFNKPVEEWGKMLDMVTKAADISVIDVKDIMDSLTYTGGIASGLGRDLEEVLGVISVMGQAGLRGRVAGTGLQAFFTRILSAGELSDTAIGNAPTDYAGQLYNAFIAEAINENGTFKSMTEVTELLDTVMGSLNDQEQAWFAKKLFGMYQMKAGYALTGAVDGDQNMIADFINQILNESTGAIDIKYELMQASQYGKLSAIEFAWQGIKTNIGDNLSPVVSTLADELLEFLRNNGNYDINWDKLKEAFEESGDLIGAQYGEQIGDLIEDIGNLGINSGLIATALAPEVGGILGGIIKLLNGDISGAIDEFEKGISDTNEEIEDLPPELRGSATAARNLITAFTALAGINLGTNILQIITSAFNTFIGKPIKALTSKVTSTSASVTSTTGTVNVGSAQQVNVASAQLMNVNASVVNVYGGGGKPTMPNTPTVPTTPALPGSPLLPTLIGGGGLFALGKGAQLMLGGGAPTAALTGSTLGALTGSKAITMYNVGGKFMSASQIASVIASKAALGGLATLGSMAAIDLFGSPGLLTSKDKRVQQGSDWLDRYSLEGNSDYSSIAGNARVYDWLRNNSGFTGNNGAAIVQAEIAGRTAAREEMLSYYKTGAGVAVLSELFSKQIEENGKITEEFLAAITQWTKDGYTYSGSNEDIKEILNFMYTNFDKEYNPQSSFFGKFNDYAINDFLSGNPILNTEATQTQLILESTQGVIDSTQSIIDSVNDAMSRIQNPNVTVNVTTNVDKSGNVITTTDVDMGTLNKTIARQASRYGATAMIN